LAGTSREVRDGGGPGLASSPRVDAGARDGLAVEATGLSKTFLQGETEVHAVRSVDLTVERGSFVAIMGPSGSGKSTLLHLIGALETPSGGRLAVGGIVLGGLSERELTRLRRDRVGFVFQFFNLLPTLTAAENVLLPALIAGERGGERSERVGELLELIGLGDRAHHLPAQLSGGEQQRVSIARALLRGPDLVLADEPTGNLDTTSGDTVLGLLRRIADDGQTVVMVSHDPDAASRADRVVFLRDGSVAGDVEGGDPERVASSFRGLGE
jgi:putative ABC transport system ATP-binding protein